MMKIITTQQFDRDHEDLPPKIKERADSKLALFVKNPRHPSLGTKKMEGHSSIWEGRVSKSYRFTFQMEKGTCILRRIGTHGVLDRP
jgi:mRNA interferase RelE/StbE